MSSTAFLPTEIILGVAAFTDIHTLNSLVRTSKWNASLLTPLLYDRGLNFADGRTKCKFLPGREAEVAGLPGEEGDIDARSNWLTDPGAPGRVTSEMLDAASVWKSEFMVQYVLDNVDTAFIVDIGDYDVDRSALELMVMAKNPLIMEMLLARPEVRARFLERGQRGRARGIIFTSNNPDGSTPLSIAVGKSDVISVQMLLDAGADPSPTLYHAASYSSLEVSEIIVKAVKARGGSVSHNMTRYQGTPLHAAAKRGSLEVVGLLLEAGADLWARSCNNLPIHSALEKPVVALKLLRAMLDCDSSVATDWKSEVLRSAIGHPSNIELIEILIDQGADIFACDMPGKTVLGLVEDLARRDYQTGPISLVGELQEVVGAILKADPYIWPQGHINRRLWELAREGPVEGGHLSLLNLLITTGKSALEIGGGDGYFSGVTALHYLCDSFESPCGGTATASSKMVSLLLDHGASISARSDSGATPLLCAVTRDRVDIVRLLLQARPQDPAINMVDRYALSPLAEAASHASPAVVKLLLDAGADVLEVSQYGTALHCASTSSCYNQSMRLLIDAGCPPAAVTASLDTALHRAVSSGCIMAIEILIAAGCGVNMRNSDGETALRLAAKQRDLAAVKELIRVAGDGIVKFDDHGSGDLVCAVLTTWVTSPHRHEAVIKLLVEHGASIHTDCDKCKAPKKQYLEPKKGGFPIL
jgi:ankyrin repeat protein